MKTPFIKREDLEKIVEEFPTPFHLYDEKGIRHYDMFGVSSNAEDHTGITKFKQSFDPTLVEYIGEFDLPINQFWFTMFQDVAPKVMEWKRKLLMRRS